ncbi:MAG: DinB family protein [Bacteroidota bacterium]|nr:DinB family protein [Bacteroidota bacterium]
MIDRWTNTIDKVTDDIKKDFGALNSAELNWKPDSNTWSIAQNIDHLIVINKTYFPVISSLKNGTYKLPWPGKISFLVNFLGKTVLNSVQPDRRKKMKTFPIWEPATSDLPATILQQFQEHQTELKRLIKSSEDLLEKNTIIASPASKMVVYKLETAFDIIVAHEQRHREQAREVLKMLPNKTSQTYGLTEQV